MPTDRTYDLIAWGATGYTGQLVARQLLDRCGVGESARIRWAIGGRSQSKLEAVRDALVAVHPDAASIPIVLGDSADADSMSSLAASARVILSTVGPFTKYGSELVAACVRSGTDYCDVTGEGPWVRDMLDQHDADARSAGVRIVSLCGYDSVPSDLMCRLLQDGLHSATGTYADTVEGLVGPIKGSFSGGTIATMIHLISNSGDKDLRRKLRDPLVFCPHRTEERTVSLRGKNRPDPMGIRHVAGAGGWTGPFIMGGINGSVIYRTNDLLGLPWGHGFVYRESTWCGKGIRGWFRALFILLLTVGLGLGLIVPPLRWLLLKTILPQPGSGPSEAAREAGHFRQRALDPKTGSSAQMSGDFDPGYTATARMLLECGLCLLEDRENLPDVCGVVTPGAAFGPLLVPRLEEVGFRIAVEIAP
ncbi:MAG: saccharopine dehydrogenase NADP-binding domain-containing protein [Phycisphaerales bacterium]|nr:saccharopine dehydrogenase NADP-binding domain-containing protein [Phycisphaerales bacterium]